MIVETILAKLDSSIAMERPKPKTTHNTIPHMINNPAVRSFVPDHFIDLNPSAWDGVRGRAHELALKSGRFSWQVICADYEQAEREFRESNVNFNATSEVKGPLPSTVLNS